MCSCVVLFEPSRLLNSAHLWRTPTTELRYNPANKLQNSMIDRLLVIVFSSVILVRISRRCSKNITGKGK